MITQDTVLILGAGASVPYGFPTGHGLIVEMANNLLDEHSKLHFILKMLGHQNDEIQDFGNRLRQTPLASIDLFLENNDYFMKMGKIAISVLLKEKENPDRLMKRDEGTHLYELLFQELGQTLDDFERHRLSIVTFNYDRSIEEFFFRSFISSFNQPDDFAMKSVLSLNVHHVYGMIGKYDDPLNPENRVRYGTAFDRDELDRMTKEIRTISEDQDIYGFQAAIDRIANAQIICFLGFGYDRTNLERLQLKKWIHGQLLKKQKVKVFGTAYKLPTKDSERVKTTFVRPITLGEKDDDCVQFLQSRRILN